MDTGRTVRPSSGVEPARRARILRNLLLAASIALLVTALDACFVSTNEPTSDLWPQIYVESYPTGTTNVTVIMKTQWLPGMTLDGGDTLTAALNGATPVTMSRTLSFHGQQAYTATLQGVSPGDQIHIAFTRMHETSAPNTVVTIPSGLTLSAPANNTGYQVGDLVHVAWPPGSPNDQVAARLEISTCTNASAADVASMNADGDAPDFAVSSDGSVDLGSTVTTSAGVCNLQVLAGNATGTISLDPAFGGLGWHSASVGLAAPRTVTFSP